MTNKEKPAALTAGQQRGLGLLSSAPVSIHQPEPRRQAPSAGYLVILADARACEALARGERAKVAIVCSARPPQSLSLRTSHHVLRVVPVADPGKAHRRVDRLLQSVRIGAGCYLASIGELRGAGC
jgi:hypothetical protein